MASLPCTAQQVPDLSACAAIVDNPGRLACYDRVVARHPSLAALPQRQTAPSAASGADSETAGRPPQQAAIAAAQDAPADNSFLIDYWELDRAHKRGLFNFRPHQINYLIANYSWRPNSAPYRPFRSVLPASGDLSRSELVYQLGFKVKLAQDVLNKPLDLWFAYTQNSFWQASNRDASSPFRETNYQPELMAVAPLHLNLLGVNARFVNLGLVHQSNGQSSSLSRSWNRAYLQLGLERGPLSVTARIWKRLHESAQDDNNPDIIDYLGRGDVHLLYHLGGDELSALLRHNFHTGRGATQLGWAFPLKGPLRGYVQVFSGYGQSLIDYNYFQRSVGAGVMLRY
jgi:phospholipase A1